MVDIVTRAGKGSPLTNAEVDANFNNLDSGKTENASAAITGGTIDNTVIGNTTPNAATFTTLTATGQTDLGGTGSGQVLRVNALTNPIQYVNIFGSTTGTTQIGAWSTNGSSSGLNFQTRGGLGFNFATNGGSAPQFNIAHTNSAVNYVQVTGAATGSRPTISSQGSDSTVGLTYVSKGTGSSSRHAFQTGSGTQFLIVGSAAGSVNSLQVSGSASGVSPVLASQGSDTNISQVFQSKGTGAIDLAAGSSGVNISNGGTVTALTLTNSGSTAYTSHPTPAITAPTTAGGVQATASSNLYYNSVIASTTIVSGGTGYTVGNTLTVSGGTFTAAAIFTVSSVSGGVVTAITATAGGTYSVIPTGTLSVTGGTGSGFTFTINGWAVRSLTITNAGSGYVEQPTVTFSGGGGSGAAAYATVGSGSIIRSLGLTGTQSLSFFTPSGEAVRIRDTGSVGAYSMFSNTAAGTTLVTQGTANAFASFNSNGTSPVLFGTNGNSGNTQMVVSHTASAVNYVQVTGAGTNASPVISAQGSDSWVGLQIHSKGQNPVQIRTNAGSQIQLQVNHTSNAVNYPTVTGGATGAAGVFGVAGTDTNIDLALTPKGTGTVVANGPFTATGQTSLGGVAGAEGLRVNTTASAISYWKFSGSDINNAPSMTVESSNTNVGLWVFSKGTGAIRFGTNSAVTNEQLRVSHTASAVNYVQVTGAATGNSPAISAQGSDANVNLLLNPKGSGQLQVFINNGSQFRVSNTASAVNYLEAKGNIASNAPILSAQGSDTNIDLTLTPKGTGNVRFGTYTGTVLTPTGYVEIKDSSGTIRRLLVG